MEFATAALWVQLQVDPNVDRVKRPDPWDGRPQVEQTWNGGSTGHTAETEIYVERGFSGIGRSVNRVSVVQGSV